MNVKWFLQRCPATECMTHPQAFLLVITHKYKTIRDRDLFISLFEPLAKYVVHHEPETLAYELSVSDKNPLEIIIFERYVYRHKNFAYFSLINRDRLLLTHIKGC